MMPTHVWTGGAALARGFAASTVEKCATSGTGDLGSELARGALGGVLDVVLALRPRMTTAECSFLTEAYPDDALKSYVIERKALWDQVGPRANAWRALRALIVAYQKPGREYFEALERAAKEEDETGVEAVWPEFDYVTPMREAWNIHKRDTLVALARYGIQKQLVENSSKRLSAKLCKDVKKSARRKAQRITWERGLGKFAQSANMFRTAALARVVDHLGEWCVDVGIALIIAARARKSTTSSKAWRAFRRAALRATCRSASLLVGGAAGAAAFALARPRGSPPALAHWGTYAALLTGELMGSIFIAPRAFAAFDASQEL